MILYYVLLFCFTIMFMSKLMTLKKKKKKSIYKLLFSITKCIIGWEKLGKSIILFSIFSLKKKEYYFILI